MSAQANPQLIQQLQQQLKDVHLPEAIGWWPMAIGWWLLCVLGVGLLSASLIFFLRIRKKNRYRKIARKELTAYFVQWQNDANNSTYLQSVNALLKRMVLHLENHVLNKTKAGMAEHNDSKKTTSASISGVVWAEKIRSFAKKPLSETTINALVDQGYQAQPDADIGRIQTELSDWIQTHQYPKEDSTFQTKQGTDNYA